MFEGLVVVVLLLGEGYLKLCVWGIVVLIGMVELIGGLFGVGIIILLELLFLWGLVFVVGVMFYVISYEIIFEIYCSGY